MSKANTNEHALQADEVTRRQWILRLGELVALAGVSGILPDVAAALAQKQGTNVASLPPGLYEASQDHLVHALSSAGKNWAPPPGSETEYALPLSGPYQPLFFEAEEFRVVSRVIEILLGAVDSAASAEAAQWFDRWLQSAAAMRTAAQQLDPLHRILAVAYYGEDSVRELENSHPDEAVRVGLRALQDLSTERHDRNFLHLTEVEQVELLRKASESDSNGRVRKFFDLTRTEAIRGYYTSPQGLEELDYKGNAYYTESPGCEGKN